MHAIIGPAVGQDVFQYLADLKSGITRELYITPDRVRTGDIRIVGFASKNLRRTFTLLTEVMRQHNDLLKTLREKYGGDGYEALGTSRRAAGSHEEQVLRDRLDTLKRLHELLKAALQCEAGQQFLALPAGQFVDIFEGWQVGYPDQRTVSIFSSDRPKRPPFGLHSLIEGPLV